MKKINETLVDKLEVEGVNANGYGIMPKIVMQDNRLTIEAKAIYAYIVSFAGAGNSAFPSLQKILSDLQISKSRFYKHRKMLIECNYITVTQIKNEKKEIIKNLYKLIANPKSNTKKMNEGGMTQNEEYPMTQNEEYPMTQNEEYPMTQNESHKSNKFKINNIKDDDDINRDFEVNYLSQSSIADATQEPTHKLFMQMIQNHKHLKSFATDLLFSGVSISDCLAIINYLATLPMTPLVAELVKAQINANELEAHSNGLTNYKAYFLTGLKQKLENVDIVDFLEAREIDVTDATLVTKQPKVTLHNWVTG